MWLGGDGGHCGAAALPAPPTLRLTPSQPPAPVCLLLPPPASRCCLTCTCTAPWYVLQVLKRHMDAVVKVFATHSKPNFSLPWQRQQQSTSKSTGFAVRTEGGERWLLTNAHSISYNTQVGWRAGVGGWAVRGGEGR